MLTIIAAYRWLAGLPRIVLVIALCVLLAVAALFFTYHAGAKHERITEQRHALADSIHKETAVKDTATQETDRARGAAHTAQGFADASRPQRQKLRDSVETMLADLPKPVVDLIHLDDQQIRRDSTALVAYIAVDTAFMHERAVTAQVDTLLQHQATIGVDPPKRGHGTLYAIGGVVVTIGAALLYHAIR